MTTLEQLERDSYRNHIIAQAIELKFKLRGTPSGNYIKMLLESMTNKHTRDGFYFSQLEGAVVEERHIL